MLIVERDSALTRRYISGPRRGTPRVAKYAAALRGGHRVVPLISEVWGGFAVDAMSFLRGLATARGDTLDVERLSTTWAARSFMSYYGQRLSVAVTVGVAIEIASTDLSAKAWRISATPLVLNWPLVFLRTSSILRATSFSSGSMR